MIHNISPNVNADTEFSVDTNNSVPHVNGHTNGHVADTMLDAALRYARGGIHVFPLTGKKPLTPQGFKNATTDLDQIRAWWHQWPNSNIGIWPGPSGLLVLDFDVYKPEFAGADLLALLLESHPTTTIDSGQGGVHMWYRTAEQFGNSMGALPLHVDIRCSNGYIVAPPSIHPDTHTPYVFRAGPREIEPQLLPQFVIDLLKQQPEPTTTNHTPSAAIPADDEALLERMFAAANGAAIRALWEGDTTAHAGDHSVADLALCSHLAFYTGCDEGRMDRLFRQSGLMREKWERDDYRTRTIGKAVAGTQRTYEPATLTPVLQGLGPEAPAEPGVGVGEGSDDSKQNDSGKPKQADLLYKLAMERGTFFTGRLDSQVYASVDVDGHRECYRMRSNEFNDWLAYAFFTQHGTTVSAQATEDCKKLLSFEARKTIDDVFVRIGQKNGRVYFDLGTAAHDAIEVAAPSWRRIDNPPVHFRRSAHALPLPLPVEYPDPALLRQYLNINDEDWTLVAAWLVAALHATGPYPVLALLSRAGSGKSTALRVLKRIIDPSSAELRAQPNDVRDLFVAAANSWLLAFDNVSYISPEVSDALCVVSTGGGYTKRANYTDGDEHVVNVQRPIVINGIGDVIGRQDLMDRAIIIGTPTIPEDQRRDETEFWTQFEQDRAKILGAFLHALSVGLANVDKVTLAKKPRMADFAKLAVASEAAFTNVDNPFMATYTANREEAAETIIENSPLGDVIRRLILVPGDLKLTPEELFTRIQAEGKDYEKSSKSWPSAPNKMKEKIERLAPALERLGVFVAPKFINGKRIYHIRRIQSPS